MRVRDRHDLWDRCGPEAFGPHVPRGMSFYYIIESYSFSCSFTNRHFYLSLLRKRDSLTGHQNSHRRLTEGMASLKFPLEILAVFVIISVILLPVAHAQSPSPAPAPTSDGKIFIIIYDKKKMIIDICFWFRVAAGTSIDQGIAFVLMMLALALTYFIHWTWWIHPQQWFCFLVFVFFFLWREICRKMKKKKKEERIRFWTSCFCSVFVGWIIRCNIF